MPPSRTIIMVGLILVAGVGCTKAPPSVVEVTGVVLLNGEPLPKAKVEFIPQLAGSGADRRPVGRDRRSGAVHLGVQVRHAARRGRWAAPRIGDELHAAGVSFASDTQKTAWRNT